MRVVLDTNILISGLLWSGNPRRILDAARQGEIQLFTTEVLLDELTDVLRRDKFVTRLEQAGVNSETLVTGFTALANLIEPQAIPPTIFDDPDDDAVLASTPTIPATSPQPRANAPVALQRRVIKPLTSQYMPIKLPKNQRVLSGKRPTPRLAKLPASPGTR
jgi:putative PIN family toxin of toxin-antitoxin system